MVFLILDVSYCVNIFIMLSTVARIGCIHSYDFAKIIKILWIRKVRMVGVESQNACQISN
jgi:hypothetical protein